MSVFRPRFPSALVPNRPRFPSSLVPKLQLGNALIFEALLRRRCNSWRCPAQPRPPAPKRSFADNCPRPSRSLGTRVQNPLAAQTGMSVFRPCFPSALVPKRPRSQAPAWDPSFPSSSLGTRWSSKLCFVDALVHSSATPKPWLRGRSEASQITACAQAGA
jgi:hypothetical protein